ncbi:phospholipase effector Tle1 domain-containing protein, partial [Flavobacterium sp. J27]|uniref:phospholipase effector Tle1 domain-containing protein n=1 Tax=Flavobacterium sp. J27 TaxID=2060419 RepID=UPI001F0DCA14
MANISFGDYSPPEPPKGAIDVLIGVFFDGTLNNKNNTQERLNNSEHFKKNGVTKKEDSSYYNDWSNVARLWKCYDSPLKTYVEGIGTEDREEDATMGFAFGTGSTGIRGKVRKGCENIVDLILKEKNKVSATRVNTLTVDVYGFSRGAAAARNFVHEISKAKYKALLKATGSRGGTMLQKTDSDGNITQRDEFPRRGHLGLKLEENEIEIDNVRVRFLGIFDTVSSYSKYFSAFPDFDDVEELGLNDIGVASNVVHYVA